MFSTKLINCLEMVFNRFNVFNKTEYKEVNSKTNYYNENYSNNLIKEKSNESLIYKKHRNKN